MEIIGKVARVVRIPVEGINAGSTFAFDQIAHVLTVRLPHSIAPEEKPACQRQRHLDHDDSRSRRACLAHDRFHGYRERGALTHGLAARFRKCGAVLRLKCSAGKIRSAPETGRALVRQAPTIELPAQELDAPPDIETLIDHGEMPRRAKLKDLDRIFRMIQRQPEFKIRVVKHRAVAGEFTPAGIGRSRQLVEQIAVHDHWDARTSFFRHLVKLQMLRGKCGTARGIQDPGRILRCLRCLTECSLIKSGCHQRIAEQQRSDGARARDFPQQNARPCAGGPPDEPVESEQRGHEDER